MEHLSPKTQGSMGKEERNSYKIYNIKPDTLILTKEKVGNMFEHIVPGNKLIQRSNDH